MLVVELTELGINGHTNYNYMFVSSLGYDNAPINGTTVVAVNTIKKTANMRLVVKRYEPGHDRKWDIIRC